MIHLLSETKSGSPETHSPNCLLILIYLFILCVLAGCAGVIARSTAEALEVGRQQARGRPRPLPSHRGLDGRTAKRQLTSSAVNAGEVDWRDSSESTTMCPDVSQQMNSTRVYLADKLDTSFKQIQVDQIADCEALIHASRRGANFAFNLSMMRKLDIH